MESLIKALPALLKSSHAPEEVAEAACIAMWKHAVGEALSAHAVPIQLRDQKLTVAVEDNLWKKQLELMRGQVLSRLNYVLGQGLVKSIELRVEPRQLAAVRGEPEKRVIKRDVSPELIPAELISVAAAIEGVSLRRAFLGAATSCIKRIERSEI